MIPTRPLLRIIFLDFDGVLNHFEWFKQLAEDGVPHGERGRSIDPAKVELVNQICERAGAVVVVSSVWRGLGRTTCTEILRACGFRGTVQGITPTDGGLGGTRGPQIQAWLDAAKERWSIERFVIIDDDSDMEHLLPRLVQTDAYVGLTEEHVNRAVAMLERDEPRAAA